MVGVGVEKMIESNAEHKRARFVFRGFTGEGYWFELGRGLKKGPFCTVCMFSLCMCGFFSGTLLPPTV